MAAKKRPRTSAPVKRRTPTRPVSRPRPLSTSSTQCPARDPSRQRCELRKGHKGPHKYPPHYTDTPAKWYRYYIEKERVFDEEGDPLEASQFDRKRLLEMDYLRESIKLLRRFVDGFEAKDGYDLNQLVHIPDSRLKKVREYAPLIREEIAQAHIVVRPRSKASREAIERHTGQVGIPRRKAYAVFTDQPENTRVKIVPAKRKVKDKRGRTRAVVQTNVEISHKVQGGKVTDRFFYFEEPPTSFDDIILQTRKMLRFMPKGYYVLVTSTHGNIAAPIHKNRLLQQLHDRFLVYDKVPSRKGVKDDRGLAEVVIGYKLIAFTEDGAVREYNERLSRREIAEAERRRIRAQQRRKALRRLRGL